MEFSEDQSKALETLTDWYKNRTALLTLGGYAGTGKTTVAAAFRKAIPKTAKVAFCAFTGKASQVLHRKLREQDALMGEDSVSTIHSLIYEAQTDEDGTILSWKKRKTLAADLIVVDEASMVSRDIYRDLSSFGVAILAIGDHGQLKPINDDFSLMAEPEISLERIHRQAEDNPIIQLSCEVRKSGRIPPGEFGKGVRKVGYSYLREQLPEILSLWDEDSLFLVSTNQHRVALNQKIRQHIGIADEINETQPVAGDKVICLRNDWVRGIYNGLTGKIAELQSKEPHWFDARIDLEDGREHRGPIFRPQFNAPKTIDLFPGLKPSEIGARFDFGYALTVHKAQGSQARRTVVLEYRHAYMKEDDWKRWLYTAVTRAEEELVVIGK